MAEIALISSHLPWAPLPRLVPWHDLGDGTIFNAQVESGEHPAAVWPDIAAVRANYLTSIEYVLGALSSYVERFGDDRLVMIVVGDHPPIPMIAGSERPRTVPVRNLSAAPAVLNATDWNWTDGMRPIRMLQSGRCRILPPSRLPGPNKSLIMAGLADAHTMPVKPRGDFAAPLQGLAPHLLPLYAPLLPAVRGGSFVFGQVGQSLDGRIATRSGDAKGVSGAAGIQHLHRLRALSDAVIVGVGTVLHDDPRLTVRECDGADPVRVLIDPNGRAPNTARVFAADGVRRIVFQRADVKRPAGVDVIRLDVQDGRIDPQVFITHLAAYGLDRIMVEGGARTLGPFLSAGALNRLLVTVSPLIIGDGPSGLSLPEVPNLCDCLRPDATFFDLGGEMVVDCALRDQDIGIANRS